MNHCAHCDHPASPGTIQLQHRRYYRDLDEDVYLVGEVGGLFVGVSVDDFSILVSYKEDGTPLDGHENRLRLVEEVNYEPVRCDRCDRPVETPEEDEDEDCEHNWVQTLHDELEGIEVCTHCHAVLQVGIE